MNPIHIILVPPPLSSMASSNNLSFLPPPLPIHMDSHLFFKIISILLKNEFLKMLVNLPPLTYPKSLYIHSNPTIPHPPNPFWALMSKTPSLPHSPPFWVLMSQIQTLHHFHPFWVLTYLRQSYPIPPLHHLKSLINVSKDTHT